MENQELQEMIRSLRAVRKEKENIHEYLHELRVRENDLQDNIVAEMEKIDAKVILHEKNRVVIREINDRKYNDMRMLELQDIVPEKLWKKAHEVKIEHKWRWVGIKELLKLGGDIKKTIEEAMTIQNVKKIEIEEEK